MNTINETTGLDSIAKLPQVKAKSAFPEWLNPADAS